MHDIQKIRDNPEEFVELQLRRGVEVDVDQIINLDTSKRSQMTKLQNLQNERNDLSQQIGLQKGKYKKGMEDELINKVRNIKEKIMQLEHQISKTTEDLEAILLGLPNLPFDDVPVGGNDSFNIEIEEKRYGNINDKKTSEHYEISTIDGMMDFETAAKVSGSRFVYLKGGLAMLERALGQFMLDTHITKNGYTEIAPPLIVNNNSMLGTAQLPKFEEDQFQVIVHDNDLADQDNRKWLIPTAEVSLTNIVREKITNKADLPLRFVALTSCFRAEAGAAGRDTRGMIRQHQFQKVELVSITEPELSEEEHNRMLECAEDILKMLELPYRVMLLSSGDMGFSSRKTYDLEVWMPGQQNYREISSVSNCGDFQARRMKARFKDDNKRTKYLHTLNGSGVAVGRALIAILENYQTPDGIQVPAVLKKYMNNLSTIKI